MALDLAMELIRATVQLEQPMGDGTRTVGTGFLVTTPGQDGRPHTILVTAGHVFEMMPGRDAKVGFRIAKSDGSWRYAPQPLKIRDADGHELWTHHPSRDVAAIAITAPPEFARAAIPLSYLAADDTFTKYDVEAGDAMMALGFPRGLSANTAGFPILRAGHLASYPVAPARIFPTFLLDFAVFPGNSGGPVFMTQQPHGRTPIAGPSSEPASFVAGLLTQEVELNSERLGIGVVTHAKFIRETIDLLAAAKLPEAPLADAAEADGKTASAAEAAKPD